MTVIKRFHFTKTASTLLGAFFLVLGASCEEKKSTDTWDNPKDVSEKSTQPATDGEQPSTSTPQKKTTPDSPKGNQPVRFLSYNLKNYLTMPRYINGKRMNASKPEEEIEALIGVIKSAKPDIVGICEIGSPDDLKDLQSRLKKAGLDLPHASHLLGYDSVRTLALISRYPVIATNKPEKDDYQVGNVPFRISRGILDVTLQLPDKKVRFLGVHFKSKRPIKEADQELMRRAESGLLRKHISQIFEQTPDVHLCVYGDFNDTKRTPTLRTAMGRLNSKDGLIVLHPTDSRNELWTHHWSREDIYSRLDFVMISKNLVPHIDKKNMTILDPANWEKASDHRAILVPIQ